MVLVPMVCDALSIPVIAAGGIGDGRSMLAAMALGADAVQVGSRFVCSVESSAHDAFKQRVISAGEGDTTLTLKELAPVRLIRNGFYKELEAAYARCASVEELKAILGRARAKRGMFEGDMEQGELEIGQISARISEVKPAATIVQEMVNEYEAAKAALSTE